MSDINKLKPIVRTEIKPTVSYKDIFNKHFTTCWKLKEGAGDKNSKNAKIDVIESRKVNFYFDSKSQTGKWSVRYKSKLLYLVPEKDEENYLVFKIINIDDENLKLKRYIDNKLSSYILHFENCK